jgi:hypothetical protein
LEKVEQSGLKIASQKRLIVRFVDRKVSLVKVRVAQRGLRLLSMTILSASTMKK